MQVAVEFKLRSNVVDDITFKTLFYKVNYINNDSVTVTGIKEQYEALLEHLMRKDIRIALKDLYEPEKIAKIEVCCKPNSPDPDKPNAFSGATLRSGKVISAIRDGLNRGVYRY